MQIMVQHGGGVGMDLQLGNAYRMHLPFYIHQEVVMLIAIAGEPVEMSNVLNRRVPVLQQPMAKPRLTLTDHRFIVECRRTPDMRFGSIQVQPVFAPSIPTAFEQQFIFPYHGCEWFDIIEIDGSEAVYGRDTVKQVE